MTTELQDLPLKPKDQELARLVEMSPPEAELVCWCERCQELHLYVMWKGRRVMLGSCGAFISK